MPDDILSGAVDMHCHAGPSLMQRDLDYVEAAIEADAAGMRAIVIKDHLFPSAVALSILESRHGALFPDPVSVEILGSICLNNQVGGLNPYALEVPLKRGARVVWLPTVSAAGHIEHRHQHGAAGSFAVLEQLLPMEPVDVVDDDGKVVPELNAIFELLKQYDAVMATGHITPQETLKVLPAARAAGVERIIVTHPTMEFVGATPDEMREMASYGVYFEHEIAGWNPSGHRRDPIDQLAGMITDFSAGQTILASDLGQVGAPHPVEGMRNTGEALADSLTSNELDAVLKKNQADLLGLN